MNPYIEIEHQRFEKLYGPEELAAAVKTMAVSLKRDFEHKHPLILVVLNGSFIFAADLLRQLDFPLDLSFIKVKSYKGIHQNDLVWELEPDLSLLNRKVLILEDIVDTGNTLQALYNKVMQQGATGCEVATLFLSQKHIRDLFKFRILVYQLRRHLL